VSIPQFDPSDVRPGRRGSQSFRKRAGTAGVLLLAGSIGGYAACGSNPATAAAVDSSPQAEAVSRTIGRGEDTYAPVVERVARRPWSQSGRSVAPV
jgi:hypothetical protein